MFKAAGGSVPQNTCGTDAEIFVDILNALRRYDACTVHQLVNEIGCSRPTLMQALTQLEHQELIQSEKSVSGARGGRPAQLYSLNSNNQVLGLLLMHNYLALASANIAGVLGEYDLIEIPALDAHSRYQFVIEKLRAFTQKHAITPRYLQVAVTGIVDASGTLIRSDLVPQWDGFPLQERLAADLNLPVTVLNNLKSAAYYEYSRLREEDPTVVDVLYVHAASSLNTSLIIGGKPHEGISSGAGELSSLLGRTLQEMRSSEDEAASTVIATALSAIIAAFCPQYVVVSEESVNRSLHKGWLRNVLLKPVQLISPAPRIHTANYGELSQLLGALVFAIEGSIAHQLLTNLQSAHGQQQTGSNCATQLQGCEIPKLKGIAKIERIAGRMDEFGVSREIQSSSTPQRELRVGVVGVGARAHLAKNAETEANNCRIVAVVEPSADAKRRIERAFGRDVPCYKSVAEMIDAGIDIAFVTSPDDTHEEVCVELLRAGIPVYLEKPLAITMDGATRILEAAEETGTKLYLGHNMRHMNVVRQMREIVRSGAIGEVKAIWCRHFVGSGGDFYFKDWHADRKHVNGLLLQKAAHDIDVMNWLCDSTPSRVVGMGGLTVYGEITDHSGQGDKLMPEWHSRDNWPPLSLTGLNEVVDVEDISMLLMQMKNGVYASYEQCHYTPDYWRNYTVIGTEGRIENFGDGEGGHIKLWNKRTTFNLEGDEVFPIKGDAHGHDDADQLTVDEFIRFVREGTPTDTNPLGAWYAVAAGIAATDSLRNGNKPVDIKDPEEKLQTYFKNHQNKGV